MKMFTIHFLEKRGDAVTVCGAVPGIGIFATWDRAVFREAIQPCLMQEDRRGHEAEGEGIGMTLTPAIKKLICHKASLIMVPPGGGVQAVVDGLLQPGRMVEAMKEAAAWTIEAIGVVRTAAEPNPWRTADDEAIAAEIMRRVEEKSAERRKARTEQ
jgi:hypothetical protein